MSLKQEIKNRAQEIFGTHWTRRAGTVIPDDQSLTLKNDGIKIKGAVLYADLASSTKIVQTELDETAAEIYKSFLYAACRVIRANGGEITAFDGDRVMAIFMGTAPNTNAAKTALQIHYAISEVVKPEFKNVYTASTYDFNFGIGIDSSDIFVAKTGIRNANDLVWVGNASNIAAKLCSIRDLGFKILLTESSYNALADTSKVSMPAPGRNMWTQTYSNEMNLRLFGSNWTWVIE